MTATEVLRWVTTRAGYVGVGIVLCWETQGLFSLANDIYCGFQMQSVLSHNRKHVAILRCHPGIGDQDYTLEVDGRKVYDSGDLGPGFLDFQHRVIWDSDSRVVTLMQRGREVVSYDAETEARK